MGRLARRSWMLVVAVVVVMLAAFAVYRLQRAFGARDETGTLDGVAEQIVPFNPKRVQLEVFGDPGATATITYMDVSARPQRVDDAALPWSYDDSTTTPAVLVNVQAQGDGDTLGCRITIDGVVKVERLSDAASAYVFCLDKSG
ncbi:MAG: transport acessory protein MmpS [Mycobacterium sp.]|nr:transport acessory protein MmpS [Mycobacterium sp.]